MDFHCLNAYMFVEKALKSVTRQLNWRRVDCLVIVLVCGVSLLTPVFFVSAVGPEAGHGLVAEVHPGLVAVPVPAAASLTAGQGVGAVASLDPLADLPCQRRAWNVVLPADRNPRPRRISRGLDRGPDLLTVATELLSNLPWGAFFKPYLLKLVVSMWLSVGKGLDGEGGGGGSFVDVDHGGKGYWLIVLNVFW